MTGPQKASAASYRLVWKGPSGTVRLSESAYAAYDQVIQGTDEISMKRKAHLERYFREFCENVHFYQRLSDEKFKKEQNFPDGKGGKVAIWAFKSWQWRLYGTIMHVAASRCFVGTAVDAAKKRNKADRKLMKAAADELAALAEYKPEPA